MTFLKKEKDADLYGDRRSFFISKWHWMVRIRFFAGANSGWSFSVDSYHFIAFSNSSYKERKKIAKSQILKNSKHLYFLCLSHPK